MSQNLSKLIFIYCLYHKIRAVLKKAIGNRLKSYWKDDHIAERTGVESNVKLFGNNPI